MESAHRRQLVSELLHAAQVLGSMNLLPATDGNFSARLDSDLVLITVRGREKREMTASDFVNARLAEAPPSNASTEWPMHRAIYQERSDVACVLHVHSPGLTAFAVAHRVPDAKLLAECLATVGSIALVPFAQPGTDAMGDALLKSDPNAGVYLLANHGAVTVGASVREALYRLERAEFLAQVELNALVLGGGRPLTPDRLSSGI